MTDERRFEQLVASAFTDTTPTPPPEDLLANAIDIASRKRRYPRWLAIIKEPPMRNDSIIAVGSPTVRVAAILAATLMLALALIAAGVAGSRLLAADGGIVVDAAGDGDFTTVAEAIAVAEDGDTILVRPGEYAETFTLSRDIELRGDGPVERIVIRAHPDVERWPEFDGCSNDGGCAILLADSDARISGLTLSGGNSGIGISGGAPTLQGLRFDTIGLPGTPAANGTGGFPLVITDGSTAAVVDNDFIASAAVDVIERASPRIERNRFSGGSSISASDPGDDLVIVGNHIEGSAGNAIVVYGPTTGLIEDNEIIGSGGDGLSIGFNGTSGVDPIVRGNSITGSGNAAITIVADAEPTIEGNTMVDNRMGVLFTLGRAVFRENELRGEGLGVTVFGGGAPLIEGNTIDVTGRALNIVSNSKPTLSGNTLCGAEGSLVVDASEPVDDGTNVLCGEVGT